MPSGAFPRPSFWNGRKRQARTRYVCAKAGTGEGCRERAALTVHNIQNGRIPRCKCGARMVPQKPEQK